MKNVFLRKWEELKARKKQGLVRKPEGRLHERRAQFGNQPTTPPRTPPPEAQTSENIVDSVVSFVRRFVFLKDESLYLLVSLWIIATYLYQEFEYAGYLFAYSPEPQSGKSRLLEVLDLLVANSSGLQVSPTPAVLFRAANGKTQLLDEIDSWSHEEDLRSVLNAGFQKGAKVTRMDQDPDSGYKAQEFSVYGPKALAGIGFNKLALATRDRTFAISMVRQRRSEKRERLRVRFIKREVATLVQKIGGWVRQNRDAIIRMYEKSQFPYLEFCSDRTLDISEPLAAILENAFEGDALSEARETLVLAIRLTRKEQSSQTANHKVLRHLLSLTELEDPLVDSASELAKMCSNLAQPPNEYDVGRVLSTYGFKARSKRKPGEDPKYRYVLSRKELQEAVDRWAGDAEDEAAADEPTNAPETQVSRSVDVVDVVGTEDGDLGQNAGDSE